jgi:hypothetical protein
VFTEPLLRKELHSPVILLLLGADRIETQPHLLLRNLATDCLPRICLRGNFLPTRCLAMGVHLTILKQVYFRPLINFFKKREKKLKFERAASRLKQEVLGRTNRL